MAIFAERDSSYRPGTANAGGIETELSIGESLMWAGQPQRKVIFHRTDWAGIPFSLLWRGFALFCEWGASGNTGKSIHSGDLSYNLFALFGMPFVLIGQYMIWGRFFYTAWKKTRTFYAVTNKRVIVLNVGGQRRFTSRDLSGLGAVTLTTREDGIGTIEFPSGEMNSPSGIFGGMSPGRKGGLQMDIDLSKLVFYDIENARGVHQLIRSQVERMRAVER